MLQEIDKPWLIPGKGRSNTDAGWSAATTLGRDQHDAVRGTRTVDRRCRRSLQDLDALNVGRIDVSRAVGCYCATLPVGDGAAADTNRHRCRRHCLVVDRLAINDEQRLVGTGE